ncbi:branched-chain amino acid aminotransferase [Rhizobium sp. L1K21]|uniref:branched-chain amino acid aminotransferase n=1 Tax=Rhizobium sp. L1K21 TaxID=2954933 RepID=UPI002093C3CC|nr:branched-chain amino acid aminotransferase [Rhizobium sp. L1K21]MCO6185678.1 branched-chain amino acid aminotransferase [Rhizobium sp. L1K21]
MAHDKKQTAQTWNFIDGEWLTGNPPVAGPSTHAMWLGSSVFDGARWFDGLTPDLNLHCQRVNRSAEAMGMKPTKTPEEIMELALEGIGKFSNPGALYIKPMYWAEEGGLGLVPVDADSTRFALVLFEAAMPEKDAPGVTLTVSPYRRPTIESMPTNAKAGCLYPNNSRIMLEARSRGFANALVRDMLGNVAETGSTNIFMVKDGVAFTPAPNHTFLAGITRNRVAGLLRADGIEVREETLTVDDFMAADEVFMTGNYSKVQPVSKLDEREFEKGAVTKKAYELYMDWALSNR